MEEDGVFGAVFLTIHLLFCKKEQYYGKPVPQKLS